MGIMDNLGAAFSDPATYQWLGQVGAGLGRAGRGQGFDITQGNQQFYQSIADKKAQERLGGLMDQFNLSPQQRSILGELPVETQQKMLAQRAFPDAGKPSDLERKLEYIRLHYPGEFDQARRIILGLEEKAGAGDGEYGLTPVYGRDANGNLVLLQMNKAGGVSQADLPEGVQSVLPNYNQQLIDTGTSVVPYDTRGGGAGTPIQKNVAEAAQQGAAGGAVGKAQAEKTLAAPQAIASGRKVKETIAGLRNDPYLPRMTGYSSYLPNVSTDAARVQSRIDQLTGEQFMEAYKTLKGGGQITEVEGKKATQAQARLAQAQTHEDYLAALDELEALVDYGIANASQEAGAIASDPFEGVDFDFTATEKAQIKRSPVGSVVQIPGAGAFIWDGERLVPQ